MIRDRKPPGHSPRPFGLSAYGHQVVRRKYRLLAVKHRPPDRGGRPLTCT